ncbi:MAG: transposon-encoded TnpW family protein [Oscillospiraceae bacterium]|nr:transposon-encoded TnpW family protein [Oscillospiraceae bacterium]
MTRATKAPTGQKKPDGTLTKQTEKHTYVMQIFFNHDSKETFQDKLLKVIHAEGLTTPITTETEPPKPA